MTKLRAEYAAAVNDMNSNPSIASVTSGSRWKNKRTKRTVTVKSVSGQLEHAWIYYKYDKPKEVVWLVQSPRMLKSSFVKAFSPM